MKKESQQRLINFLISKLKIFVRESKEHAATLESIPVGDLKVDEWKRMCNAIRQQEIQAVETAIEVWERHLSAVDKYLY
jgi:hypothetical protein